MTTATPQLNTDEMVSALDAVELLADAGQIHVKSASHAVQVIQAAERLTRLAAVARVDVIAAVDESRTHRLHGHSSAHVMVRHLGRVSSGETARADKIRRLIGGCELIEAEWRSGGVSVDQAGVLGRAYANPRVRDQFTASQARFLRWLNKPFLVFERKVADWVRLADEDGPAPRPEPAHQNRDISLIQDHFSQAWAWRGSIGSLQGAMQRRVLDAYVSAERLADWEQAREIHGDAATREDLPRTEAQRRADALQQIFADALHNPNRSVAIDTIHNIVWSEESFEHELRRMTGEDAKPVDVDAHRCHNLDGHGLDPVTAFSDFLISKWRRVVQNAAGITIDMSVSQRFFSGLARLGVQLSFDSCYWPGCSVPVTACQIDHLKPAACGGLTKQINGAPACQKHNRLKERGYTVTRFDDGTINIQTATGETLPQ